MDALTGLGRQTDARDGLMGRMFKIQKKSRVFKIEISMVSSSTLAAEICTDSHNRLLRRQHGSSLCSQSEGHEHVANMTSALGHDFVGFSARAWPPQYSPPSLCEQSELQCFASYLCQMSARCPLQRCRIPLFPWLRFFFRFNRLPSFPSMIRLPLSRFSTSPSPFLL